MPLTVVYAREEVPTSYTASIFLMGPTPREPTVASWRPHALRELEAYGYDGVVFIPEDRPDVDGTVHFRGDYTDQVDWEEQCLNLADVILCWVPRDLETLPGLTTNVEWGVWCDSGKIVFGAPDEAVKNRYLEHYALKLNVPTAKNLVDTVGIALGLVGRGVLRTHGEREVPLMIWRTPHFQQWYANLQAAGNVLEHAKVKWTFRSRSGTVFLWALHVEIYVTDEQRSKVNEVVLSRPDIATIVLYQRAEPLNTSLVALVTEFRSPVSNTDGYVWELPGGSSFKPGQDPHELAAHECYEETGLELAAERFVQHQTRQMVATFSTHRAHLFSAELTDDEVLWLRSQGGIPHGIEADSERTFVQVTTLYEIRRQQLVDWAMLGMIMQVLT